MSDRGMTVTEIAVVLNEPRDNIQKTLDRALRKLRRDPEAIAELREMTARDPAWQRVRRAGAR